MSLVALFWVAYVVVGVLVAMTCARWWLLPGPEADPEDDWEVGLLALAAVVMWPAIAVLWLAAHTLGPVGRLIRKATVATGPDDGRNER